MDSAVLLSPSAFSHSYNLVLLCGVKVLKRIPYDFDISDFVLCCANVGTYVTTRFVSVNWVACGTCYTKTEGTELGGVELYFFLSGGVGGGGGREGDVNRFWGHPHVMPAGPLAHTLNYFVMSCAVLRSFTF